MNELEKAQRRLRAAQQDLLRVHDAPRLQKEAELLKTAKAKRFDTEIEVTDYAQFPAQKIRIVLKPGEPLQVQIEKRFKAAKRLSQAEPKVQKRIEDITAHIEKLQNAPPQEEEPKQRSQKPQQKEFTPLPYREYFSTSGRAIWVGKGASKNDELTFKKASPHALWLHATGFAGAHVVVPARKLEEVDAQTIEDAARLAAHFSKAPQGFVEVAVTQVKFVRKVKGAKAGQVALSRERQYRVDNDPAKAKAIAHTAPTTHDSER